MLFLRDALGRFGRIEVLNPSPASIRRVNWNAGWVSDVGDRSWAGFV